jgi:hypothetical protein
MSREFTTIPPMMSGNSFSVYFPYQVIETHIGHAVHIPELLMVDTFAHIR